MRHSAQFSLRQVQVRGNEDVVVGLAGCSRAGADPASQPAPQPASQPAHPPTEPNAATPWVLWVSGAAGPGAPSTHAGGARPPSSPEPPPGSRLQQPCRGRGAALVGGWAPAAGGYATQADEERAFSCALHAYMRARHPNGCSLKDLCDGGWRIPSHFFRRMNGPAAWLKGTTASAYFCISGTRASRARVWVTPRADPATVGSFHPAA